MNGLKLVKRLWQALPLSDHNRWRVTVLLLEPILPFIKGSVISNAYLREKEWQTKRIRPFHGDRLPTLPSQEKADVFFWGIIDWRFRIQRPQHLAMGFAKRGHRVFYISTSFVNTGRPGFELERMDHAGCLFNVRFHLKGRPQVYAAPPTREDFLRLGASLASLLEWSESRAIISVVQHPYWGQLASKVPDSCLIYDCMDHHDGFDNTGEGIAALELTLLKEADAVVTTSQWLRDFAAAHNPNVTLIRNAVEYDFFAVRPMTVFRDTKGRRVLGYYGAIAEWLDVELLAETARRFSDCLLLLVGADECGARQHLAGLPNVMFTGEVRYTELPFYLYGMDVCLLPFHVIPLTIATNPVKVYEYLSAGKPVVSVSLPELDQFGSLVVTAKTHEEFTRRLDEALADLGDNKQLRRQSFASQNTWWHRVEAFDSLICQLNEAR